MRFLLLALLLIASPASADELYALYAGGKYDEAMRAGAAANTAEGFAIAARAALADAAMRPAPCLSCLKRAEDFARKAVAEDASQADGHVWLAASLGLEGRIVGLVRARLAGSAEEAKKALDIALKDDPGNAYALAAMGGWNIEIVRAGGSFLARSLYGASEAQGLAQFDRAVKEAPGNVAVRYQIGLSLSGYKPQAFHGRIAEELNAAIHAEPQTTYEKFIQTRAAELLRLQTQGDAAAFSARVRAFQGYPD
jgi:hypothetical protein